MLLILLFARKKKNALICVRESILMYVRIYMHVFVISPFVFAHAPLCAADE